MKVYFFNFRKGALTNLEIKILQRAQGVPLTSIVALVLIKLGPGLHLNKILHIATLNCPSNTPLLFKA